MECINRFHGHAGIASSPLRASLESLWESSYSLSPDHCELL